MFESPRSLWQHFAVAIVAVLVIMSLSSVNANNENDRWMLMKLILAQKRRSCREVRIRNRYFEKRPCACANVLHACPITLYLNRTSCFLFRSVKPKETKKGFKKDDMVKSLMIAFSIYFDLLSKPKPNTAGTQRAQAGT